MAQDYSDISTGKPSDNYDDSEATEWEAIEETSLIKPESEDPTSYSEPLQINGSKADGSDCVHPSLGHVLEAPTNVDALKETDAAADSNIAGIAITSSSNRQVILFCQSDAGQIRQFCRTLLSAPSGHWNPNDEEQQHNVGGHPKKTHRLQLLPDTMGFVDKFFSLHPKTFLLIAYQKMVVRPGPTANYKS